MAEQIGGQEPDGGKERGQPGSPCLKLWFAQKPELQLIKTEFTHRLLGGATRRASVLDRKRSFSWSKGVRATSALVLRWTAWGLELKRSSKAKMPVLEGVRHTPAATLNDLLTRDPTWVSDVFGRGVEGRCLLDEMVARFNRDFKKLKDGPVTIVLKPRLLPPDCVEVRVGGALVTDASQLKRMAAEIERQAWPDSKGYRWDAALGGEGDEQSPVGGDKPEQPENSRPEIPDGLQRHWISFHTLIQERARDFVGREFVFKEIEGYFTSNRSGYFLITGDPGIGKSAIMAELVRRGLSRVHHFNVSLQSINTPRHFLGNICSQLIVQCGLGRATLPDGFDEDGVVLNDLLLEAAGTLGRHERLLIAIDALDEVSDLRGTGPSNPLRLPPELPSGVCVVMTSRRKGDAAIQALAVHEWPLDPLSDLNEQDIGAYVAKRAGSQGIRAWMASRKLNDAGFGDLMWEKSEGNFMYLRHVLPAIEQGRFSANRATELPHGLRAYYRSHWNQMRRHEDAVFETVYQPVLCVLAAAKEAVAMGKIVEWTRLAPRQVKRVLRDWWEFLHVEKGLKTEELYRVYHTAFREFLEAEVDPGLKTYHAMIAQATLAKVRRMERKDRE